MRCEHRILGVSGLSAPSACGVLSSRGRREGTRASTPGAQSSEPPHSRGLSAHRSRGPRPPHPRVSLRAGLANQGAPAPSETPAGLPAPPHHDSRCRFPPRPAGGPARPARLHRLPATDGRSRAKSRRSSRDSAGGRRPLQQQRRAPSDARWAEPGSPAAGRPCRRPSASHARRLPEAPKRMAWGLWCVLRVSPTGT